MKPDMTEKIKQLPHPGWRTIKTALAVVTCILLYESLSRPGTVLAVMATVICMQDSVGKSLHIGRNRVFGILLGGLFAVIIGALGVAQMQLWVFAPLAFVAVVLFIFICNRLEKNDTIMIGLTTLFIILFELRLTDAAPLPHALNRSLDTGIGVVVAYLVNKFVFPPKPEKFRGRGTKNPAFHYEHRKADHHKAVSWQGGYTRELYIYPEQTLYQDEQFDFRATVRFTEANRTAPRRFPGYKRQIMLLDGQLHICHAGWHEITLGAFETDNSRGDWETSITGSGTDLTLLTSPGYAGELTLLHPGQSLMLKNDHFVSFYALADNTKCYLTNRNTNYKELLQKGDSLLIGWFENGKESYTIRLAESEMQTETSAPVLLMISCKKIAGNIKRGFDF